jgi:hypothetical protein
MIRMSDAACTIAKNGMASVGSRTIRSHLGSEGE